MPIQDLIDADYTKRLAKKRDYERDELNKLVNVRGMADLDGMKFQEELEKSKMRFGPYALKLAKDFVNRQLNKNSNQGKAKQEDQERISFVKMEMFLFGIVEANRVCKQLGSMERTMERLEDQLDEAFKKQRLIDDKRKSS